MNITVLSKVTMAAEAASRSRRKNLDGMSPEEKKQYARNIITSLKHTSIAEHNVYHLLFSGISRLAAEIIGVQRHLSIVEESQRYTEPKEFAFYAEGHEEILDAYHMMRNAGIKKEDARFILPLSIATTMQVTINELAIVDLVEDLINAAMYYNGCWHDELVGIVNRLSEIMEYSEMISPINTMPVVENLKGTNMVNISVPNIWKRVITDQKELPKEVMDLVSVQLQCIVDSATYQQLKRYRNATVIPGAYEDASNIDLFLPGDLMTPEIVQTIGKSLTMMRNYYNLQGWKLILGATKRSVIMIFPLSSALHMCEQRLSPHAQAPIREIATMVIEAIYSEGLLDTIMRYWPLGPSVIEWMQQQGVKNR